MNANKIIYSRVIDAYETISQIDFSILNNKSILEDSVITNNPNGITNPELYSNGEPVHGGVLDKRLGTTEPRQRCDTCGENAYDCPGHFGHIKLVTPVFHIGYIQYLKSIFSCICIKCHKLLVHKNEQQISRLLKNKQSKQRFQEIRNICKTITHCQQDGEGCGTPVHKITINMKSSKVLLIAEAVRKTADADEGEDTRKKVINILTPQDCYDILKDISAEDLTVMGFNPQISRPEDMIYVNFPMPPVQVRPSIKTEQVTSSSSDDDLTHKLADIVKNNENLRNARGDGSLSRNEIDDDDFTLLQIHIATYYVNDKVGLPKSQQKNKKLTKSFTERLKGKEGRVRGNLMGKRVNMSGRTVITSDPKIGLNQVGIPLIIAKNLTFPEIVTPQNINYLQELVKNGRRVYPGANFVIKTFIDEEGRESEHTYHLKYMEKHDRPIILKPGDIVERQLVNGDIVIFNRQPSLHKLSMMGHICHIINDKNLLTFRVNVSVTEPYNADWYRFNHLESKSATGSCSSSCWFTCWGKQCKINPVETGCNYLVHCAQAA